MVSFWGIALMSDLYDIIVVGAGPGGSAAAHYMARQGLNVLLLDKSGFPRDKTCGDALSPNALHILEDMGAMPDLVGAGAYKVAGVDFYSPDSTRLCALVPPHPPFPQYAYVARRLVLDDLIREKALQSGAKFEARVRVAGIEGEPGNLTVIGVRDGAGIRYRCRLAVIAVGASVNLLHTLGLVNGQPDFARAARTYYEGINGLSDLIQIRFDGVPLPGYGWIFPLSSTSANVGAGFYRHTRHMPPTAQRMLAEFLEHPPVKEMLVEAVQEGPVKGFPLRVDFNKSRVIGEGIMLVGESAGLVNPFTGEGIDYALESARMAARTASYCFAGGGFSRRALKHYERQMRQRFQRLFVMTHLLREFYMNSWLLNPLVRAGNRWPDVSRVLVDVLLSYKDPAQALSPGVVVKVLLSAAQGAP